MFHLFLMLGGFLFWSLVLLLLFFLLFVYLQPDDEKDQEQW